MYSKYFSCLFAIATFCSSLFFLMFTLLLPVFSLYSVIFLCCFWKVKTVGTEIYLFSNKQIYVLLLTAQYQEDFWWGNHFVPAKNLWNCLCWEDFIVIYFIVHSSFHLPTSLLCTSLRRNEHVRVYKKGSRRLIFTYRKLFKLKYIGSCVWEMGRMWWVWVVQFWVLTIIRHAIPPLFSSI